MSSFSRNACRSSNSPRLKCTLSTRTWHWNNTTLICYVLFRSHYQRGRRVNQYVTTSSSSSSRAMASSKMEHNQLSWMSMTQLQDITRRFQPSQSYANMLFDSRTHMLSEFLRAAVKCTMVRHIRTIFQETTSCTDKPISRIMRNSASCSNSKQRHSRLL